MDMTCGLENGEMQAQNLMDGIPKVVLDGPIQSINFIDKLPTPLQFMVHLSCLLFLC